MNPDIEKRPEQYRYRVAAIPNNPLNYSNMFYGAAQQIGFDLMFAEIPDNIKKRHPENSIFILTQDEKDIERLQILRKEFAKQNSSLFVTLQSINVGALEAKDPKQLKGSLVLSLRGLLDQLKSNPLYAPEFED